MPTYAFPLDKKAILGIPTHMNNDEIKAWLSSIGRDRVWLATQCGVSKRTVDGWFSADKGMPLIAQRLIEKIMGEQSLSDLKMRFNDWHKIYQAMAHSGYTNFEAFAMDALNDYASQKHPEANLQAVAESNSSYPKKKS